jgi:hypothetical protein
VGFVGEGASVEVGIGVCVRVGDAVIVEGEKGVEDGVAFFTSVTKIKGKCSTAWGVGGAARTHPVKNNPPQKTQRAQRKNKAFLCEFCALCGERNIIGQS